MQIFESHTGISSARFRFSHFAVAVRQRAVHRERADGSRSPLPARMTAVTFCTKSGARSDTAADGVLGVDRRRHANLVQVRQRLIDDLAVAPHDLGPRLP
jgi:hypothetical protein